MLYEVPDASNGGSILVTHNGGWLVHVWNFTSEQTIPPLMKYQAMLASSTWTRPPLKQTLPNSCTPTTHWPRLECKTFTPDAPAPQWTHSHFMLYISFTWKIQTRKKNPKEATLTQLQFSSKLSGRLEQTLNLESHVTLTDFCTTWRETSNNDVQRQTNRQTWGESEDQEKVVN